MGLTCCAVKMVNCQLSFIAVEVMEVNYLNGWFWLYRLVCVWSVNYEVLVIM